VRRARDAARRWAAEEGSRISGFHGAYFAGSVLDLPDDAVLPATSDLDVNLVVAASAVPEEREKLRYEGVLLEISYLPLARVQTAEQVLGDYHLAGGFRTPGIIADPSGHLATLQRVVAREFARRPWVRRRCEHARRRVLEGLAALDPSATMREQAHGLLFPTGQTAHILLVAGLRNPTVRRRYAAVRELLAAHRRLDVHEELLELLGSGGMTRARVEGHFGALTEAFDAAAALIRTPFPFASDIGALARPLAIDGSRELIEQGFHREAMFWIAVTASRCQDVFAADAPAEVQRRFAPAYHELLADLGIASPAAIQRQIAQIHRALPAIWRVAEAIMAANTAIRD
jgi:hypothetical protein